MRKVDCLDFLNETDSENLLANIYNLEKTSTNDLLDSNNQLITFYLKIFYSPEAIDIKNLGRYIFFVKDIITCEKKDIIIGVLEEATIQADAKILATIIINIIKETIVNERHYRSFRTITEKFILQAIESNKKGIALFLREFELATSNLLSTRTLNRRNQALVALKCFSLINEYKQKRRTE